MVSLPVMLRQETVSQGNALLDTGIQIAPGHAVKHVALMSMVLSPVILTLQIVRLGVWRSITVLDAKKTASRIAMTTPVTGP